MGWEPPWCVASKKKSMIFGLASENALVCDGKTHFALWNYSSNVAALKRQTKWYFWKNEGDCNDVELSI